MPSRLSILFCFSLFCFPGRALAEKPKDADSLVQMLGHSSWHERERASKELDLKMNFELAKKFSEESENISDLEVKRRLQCAVRNYLYSLRQVFKIDFKGYRTWPWIDMMPIERIFESSRDRESRQNIICDYVELANFWGAPNDGPPNWEDYRWATRIWAGEKIDALIRESFAKTKTEEEFKKLVAKGLNPIQKDIEEMIIKEGEYKRKIGLDGF